MRQLGITNALKVPLPFAEQELKMALITYKAAKKNADVWRDDHILSLAEARAAKKATTVEAEQQALAPGRSRKRGPPPSLLDSPSATTRLLVKI